MELVTYGVGNMDRVKFRLDNVELVTCGKDDVLSGHNMGRVTYGEGKILHFFKSMFAWTRGSLSRALGWIDWQSVTREMCGA